MHFLQHLLHYLLPMEIFANPPIPPEDSFLLVDGTNFRLMDATFLLLLE